jgi:hypothetical protein
VSNTSDLQSKVNSQLFSSFQVSEILKNSKQNFNSFKEVEDYIAYKDNKKFFFHASPCISARKSTLGTASYPAVTKTYGYATNLVSAATANSNAGLYSTDATLVGGIALKFKSMVSFPDSNYGAGNSGTFFMTGIGRNSSAWTNSSMTSVSRVGFRYDTNINDINFVLVIYNGINTPVILDTGMPFSAMNLYEFNIEVSNDNKGLSWKIINKTNRNSNEGVYNINGLSTILNNIYTYYSYATIKTLSNVARNIRINLIESIGGE